MARTILATVPILCCLSALPFPVSALPFVMQCAESETLSRVVIRTERASRFLAIDCSTPSGARRIFKVGREEGARREIKLDSPIRQVGISKGRCGADRERVCSIAFETADGANTGAIGEQTSARTTLNGQGDVYGFYGDADTDIHDLGILTRKSSSLHDSNYDISAVLEDIREGMIGAMGFAAVIHDNVGRRKGFVRAGWAIHPLDAELAADAGQFDVRTKFPVGSTAKAWASAAAALRVDEDTPGDTIVAPLRSVLPTRWAADLNSRFRQVTVLDVIKHRAGFRRSGPSTQDTGGEKPVRFRLRSGEVWPNSPSGVCSNADRDTVFNNSANRLPNGSSPPFDGCYSNATGGLFHYILPYMAADPEIRKLEQQLKNAPDDEYDRRISEAAGKFYYDYVQEKILAPAGVEANCDIRDFMNRHQVAASYDGLSDRNGWLTPDNESACAAGGWVISVSDLATLVNALAGTKNVLNAFSRVRMFKPASERVWHIIDGDAHVHGGDRRKYSADVVRFNDGYVAVLAYNSPPASAVNGRGLLLRAMRNNRR